MFQRISTGLRRTQAFRARRWQQTNAPHNPSPVVGKSNSQTAALVLVGAGCGMAAAHFLFDYPLPWEPKSPILGSVIEGGWESTVFVGHHEGGVEKYLPNGVVLDDSEYALILEEKQGKKNTVRLRVGNTPTVGSVVAHDKTSKITLVKLPPVAGSGTKAARSTHEGTLKMGDYVFCAPNITSATANMAMVDSKSTVPLCSSKTGADSCRLHYQKLRGASYHGGPVFTLDGSCAGLQVPYTAEEAAEPDTCYILTAPELRYIANELRQYGYVRRPYLGMKIADHVEAAGAQGEVVAADAHVDGNGNGDGESTAAQAVHVVVEKVESGSPADIAGIRSGDRIVAVNGETTPTVMHTLHALGQEVRGSVEITVVRMEGALSREVKLHVAPVAKKL